MGSGGIDLLDDRLPALEQHVQVVDETTSLLAFTSGVNDDAHAFGDGEGTNDVLQALARGVFLDIAGDAARAAERHE